MKGWVKVFRMLTCLLFGHRSICLLQRLIEHGNGSFSYITGWQCERCGKTKSEQWDE